MQLLFNKANKKYLNSMLFFQEALIVKGETPGYINELIEQGGKLDKHRHGWTIDSSKEKDIKKLSRDIGKTKIEKLKLVAVCTITIKETILKISGNTQPFLYELLYLGGTFDKETNTWTFPADKEKEIKKISAEIETYYTHTEKLTDVCTITTITDPSPQETINRVGRNYLGEDLSKYIVISMDNNVFKSMETDIRSAKDIQLGELPEQNEDGSYSYTDGMFTVVPKDPPSAEELAKQEESKQLKSTLISTGEAIKNTNPVSIGSTAMVRLICTYKQCELKLKGMR